MARHTLSVAVLAILAVAKAQTQTSQSSQSSQASKASNMRGLPTDYGFDPQSALMMDLLKQQG
jgi:hypothetical protein